MVGRLFTFNILDQLKKYYALYTNINFNDSTSRLTACNVLLFCHDADRGIKLNGKAYSPLMDSVKEDLERRGLKCLSLAHPFSVLTDEKGYAAPISINRSYLIHRIATRILPIRFRSTVFTELNVYKKIKNKTGAKLLITIGASDDLCEEARRLGLFHVELLHGIGYADLLWGWGNKPAKHLPQGVLSLDHISTLTFSPLNRLNISIKTIPHPFLKRFLGENKNRLPREWTPTSVDKLVYKKEILVTLAWGYAGDHGQEKEFADILDNGLFYNEIADAINVSQDIFWRFRFHPVQLRKRKYKYLLAYMDHFITQHPNTEWRESSSLPLSTVAMNCSGHISMSSMAAYDVSALGVPSLMLCPTIQPGAISENKFSDLVKEGYVIKANVSKETILCWVNEVEQLPQRLSNLEDEAAWECAVKWMLSSSSLDSTIKEAVS